MGKILVVEDKQSMAEMLRETLELEGHDVILAGDGVDGIKKLKDNPVDLIITDMKLPKKNGLEVLKASKNQNPLVKLTIRSPTNLVLFSFEVTFQKDLIKVEATSDLILVLIVEIAV